MDRVAYLGIDPGIKGYYCLLVPDTKYVDYLSIDNTGSEVVTWLTNHTSNYQITPCIEKVRNIYGVSSKSNFNFGYIYGYSVGILSTIFSEIHTVPPKKWQSDIGVTKTGKDIKKEVFEIVRMHYPDVNYYGKRGGLLDGKSDSLAIAHWASRNINV